MKAYKFEVLITDNEEVGHEEIKAAIENMRYFFASVMQVKQVDVGEWHDDHPLNKCGTMAATYYSLPWEDVK